MEAEREYKEYYAENMRGISGWFKVRAYTLERWLYAAHRVTGILIILWIVTHLYSVGWHPGTWWDALLGVVITFHVANGIRLILVELGIGIGKPLRVKKPSQRPVSIEGIQKYVIVASLALFVILAVIWSYYALIIEPLMGGG